MKQYLQILQENALAAEGRVLGHDAYCEANDITDEGTRKILLDKANTLRFAFREADTTDLLLERLIAAIKFISDRTETIIEDPNRSRIAIQEECRAALQAVRVAKTV